MSEAVCNAASPLEAVAALASRSPDATAEVVHSPALLQHPAAPPASAPSMEVQLMAAFAAVASGSQLDPGPLYHHPLFGYHHARALGLIAADCDPRATIASTLPPDAAALRDTAPWWLQGASSAGGAGSGAGAGAASSSSSPDGAPSALGAGVAFMPMPLTGIVLPVMTRRKEELNLRDDATSVAARVQPADVESDRVRAYLNGWPHPPPPSPHVSSAMAGSAGTSTSSTTSSSASSSVKHSGSSGIGGAPPRWVASVDLPMRQPAADAVLSSSSSSSSSADATLAAVDQLTGDVLPSVAAYPFNYPFQYPDSRLLPADYAAASARVATASGAHTSSNSSGMAMEDAVPAASPSFKSVAHSLNAEQVGTPLGSPPAAPAPPAAASTADGVAEEGSGLSPPPLSQPQSGVKRKRAKSAPAARSRFRADASGVSVDVLPTTIAGLVACSRRLAEAAYQRASAHSKVVKEYCQAEVKVWNSMSSTGYSADGYKAAVAFEASRHVTELSMVTCGQYKRAWLAGVRDSLEHSNTAALEAVVTLPKAPVPLSTAALDADVSMTSAMDTSVAESGVSAAAMSALDPTAAASGAGAAASPAPVVPPSPFARAGDGSESGRRPRREVNQDFSYFEDACQPVRVKVMPDALCLMDAHSHTTLNEVIGLLLGRIDKGTLCREAGDTGSVPGGAFANLVTVELAIPGHPSKEYIDASKSTRDVNVEIDAGSQLRISELADQLGLRVVGWYHSHPAFQPDPSLVDCNNQAHRQQQALERIKHERAANTQCAAPHAHAACEYYTPDRADTLEIAAIVSPYNISNPGPSPQWRWFHTRDSPEGAGAELGAGVQHSASGPGGSLAPRPMPMSLLVSHERYLQVAEVGDGAAPAANGTSADVTVRYVRGAVGAAAYAASASCSPVPSASTTTSAVEAVLSRLYSSKEYVHLPAPPPAPASHPVLATAFDEDATAASLPPLDVSALSAGCIAAVTARMQATGALQPLSAYRPDTLPALIAAALVARVLAARSGTEPLKPAASGQPKRGKGEKARKSKTSPVTEQPTATSSPTAEAMAAADKAGSPGAPAAAPAPAPAPAPAAVPKRKAPAKAARTDAPSTVSAATAVTAEAPAAPAADATTAGKKRGKAAAAAKRSQSSGGASSAGPGAEATAPAAASKQAVPATSGPLPTAAAASGSSSSAAAPGWSYQTEDSVALAERQMALTPGMSAAMEKRLMEKKVRVAYTAAFTESIARGWWGRAAFLRHRWARLQSISRRERLEELGTLYRPGRPDAEFYAEFDELLNQFIAQNPQLVADIQASQGAGGLTGSADEPAAAPAASDAASAAALPASLAAAESVGAAADAASVPAAADAVPPSNADVAAPETSEDGDAVMMPVAAAEVAAAEVAAAEVAVEAAQSAAPDPELAPEPAPAPAVDPAVAPLDMVDTSMASDSHADSSNASQPMASQQSDTASSAPRRSGRSLKVSTRLLSALADDESEPPSAKSVKGLNSSKAGVAAVRGSPKRGSPAEAASASAAAAAAGASQTSRLRSPSARTRHAHAGSATASSAAAPGPAAASAKAVGVMPRRLVTATALVKVSRAGAAAAAAASAEPVKIVKKEKKAKKEKAATPQTSASVAAATIASSAEKSDGLKSRSAAPQRSPSAKRRAVTEKHASAPKASRSLVLAVDRIKLQPLVAESSSASAGSSRAAELSLSLAVLPAAVLEVHAAPARLLLPLQQWVLTARGRDAAAMLNKKLSAEDGCAGFWVAAWDAICRRPERSWDEYLTAVVEYGSKQDKQDKDKGEEALASGGKQKRRKTDSAPDGVAEEASSRAAAPAAVAPRAALPTIRVPRDRVARGESHSFERGDTLAVTAAALHRHTAALLLLWRYGPDMSLLLASLIDVIEYYRCWAARVDLVNEYWDVNIQYGTSLTLPGDAGAPSAIKRLDKLIASVRVYLPLLPLLPHLRLTFLRDLRAYIQLAWDIGEPAAPALTT